MSIIKLSKDEILNVSGSNASDYIMAAGPLLAVTYTFWILLGKPKNLSSTEDRHKFCNCLILGTSITIFTLSGACLGAILDKITTKKLPQP